MLEDGIANIYGDRFGEHGVEGLGVMDDRIISTSGECVCNVGGEDILIFGDNIAIGLASGGYEQDSVRPDGITFQLVCMNAKFRPSADRERRGSSVA